MVAAVDVALCALTVWLAYYLRLGVWISLFGRPSLAVGLSVALALPIYMTAGLYRTVFRHVDARIISVIAGASLCYGICYATIISAYAFDNIPRTVGLIQPVLLFLGICLSRMLASWALGSPLGCG